MNVVPGRRVTLPQELRTLDESTLHLFYCTLTASVYIASFTLASGIKVTLFGR